MESFTLKGVWWLPENPNHTVEGNLAFDPRGRSKLEIFDTFQTGSVKTYADYFPPRVVPVVLGEDDTGQEITLIESDEYFQPSGNRPPWEYAWYRPRNIVRGLHIKTLEDFAFNQLTVDYYGLQVWADPRRNAGSLNPVPIASHESLTDDICVSTGKFSLRIRRGFPHDAQLDDEVESQASSVNFLSDDPLNFDVLLGMITDFQFFLSLAMRISTWPTVVQAPHPNEENNMISIHFAPVTEYRNVDGLTSSSMYFTLEDALPFLERGLQNWFEKSELLSNVLEMYNWAISRELFIQELFMLFARAAEVVHRQLHGGTYMDKGLFDETKEQLKDSVRELFPSNTNKDLRRRIYENVNSANLYSLKDRFYDIQERHQRHSNRLFKDYDCFVEHVVDTRNYLTHFAERDKKKAKLEFEDLYKMSDRLRVILEVSLLSVLDLEDAELEQIIYRPIEKLIM